MKVFLDASFIIYLNVDLPEEDAEKIDALYKRLVENEELYTDPLVLDEVIYVLWKKYRIPYEETIDMLDDIIIPYVSVLPVGLMEYLKARQNILKYGLRPSDALHLAVIENSGIQAIVTEDCDFDDVPVKRIWI
ncbi:type II toxin-antitoxin system VapC family toxin [Pyrococcus yayanosii]|uniref:Nucleotide binding protein, putative, containing PIN domain n=1 Tax=Pyrococcus yayanosii (strain CH1 / JCM 16557) TaxID=529709 RepID=F8AIC8_PYRYC|nr:type II toxin-antitoxin system VapC family toxin [Pyrococcus yayanosii]AEH25531.1 Nucleotide binding protein, putative, containing PIN domain [Pyrococcus yayanosii CH1]